MKVPVHIAEKLLQLLQGEKLPASSAKHALVEELVMEGIIERTGRVQKTMYVSNRDALLHYLRNKYGINSLEQYMEVCRKETSQRHELAAVSSNSKLKSVRTFKGFLINSYEPVRAILNGRPVSLDFTDGIFSFVYDYENFIPDSAMTIVGVENAENFRLIERQKYLFEHIRPLFVSRYPQSQSRDLIKWLLSVPNHYLHFGDFDFAGIGIYINEYRKHLSGKASFFIPNDIEKLIAVSGNKDRYDQQAINFDMAAIQEPELLSLIRIIHRYKKGADQEILIR